jgi:adenylosuccinate lyase
MKSNLESTRGLIYSQQVLLALVTAGMTREEAYAVVQRHAMAAWREAPDLKERLLSDPAVTRVLPPEKVAACFDASHFTRHVRRVFERVLGAEEPARA